MKSWRHYSWLLLVVLLLWGGQETVQAQEGFPIDTSDGQYTSLALDASGNPIISYYDGPTTSLKIVRCDLSGPAITCETPVIVDNTGTVGKFTSLALDGSNSAVISYFDDTNDVLKLARCDISTSPITCPTTITIDSKANWTIGQYSSLALDQNGYPVISYLGMANDFSDTDLMLARCADVNCSSFSTNLVNSTTSGAESFGLFNSLALDSSDNPVISYYHSTNGYLTLAHCNDLYCAGNDETINTVDTTGNNGWHTSLILNGDNPVISYYNTTTFNLMLAHCNDTDCAGGNESIEILDGDTNVGWNTSLTLDGGNPVVSYYDRGNSSLKLARCDDPNCTGGGEQLLTLDNTGNVGKFTSLALDGSILVISYWDESNTALKFMIVLRGLQATLTAPDNSAFENQIPADTGQFSVNLNQTNNTSLLLAVDYAVGVTSTATAGVDYTPLTGSVNISPGATTAAINVVPLDDFLDEPDETIIVNLSNIGPPGIYFTVDPTPATVTIGDANTAGVIINPQGVSAVEGGSTAYTLALAMPPEASETVTVTINNNSGGEITTINGSAAATFAILFDTSNWTGVPVTLVLSDDTRTDGNRFIADALTHTVTSNQGNSNYNYVTAGEVVLDVIDNETPNIVVDPTAFSLDINQTGMYEVYLSQQPTGNVTVDLTPANANCAYDTSTLLFTPTDWADKQIVKVTGGGTGGVICTVAHAATGGGYDGVTGQDVNTFLQALTGSGTSAAATTTTTVNETTIVQTTTVHGDINYIHKAVDNAYPAAGETVTYTITAHNPKTIPLTEVVIYDVFDQDLQHPTLVSTTHGTGMVDEGTLVVSGFTLQPGETATIRVSAVVSSNLQPGQTIPNIAALESPDASVHVSNLVVLGDGTMSNDGAIIITQTGSPAQALPNTGYPQP